MEVVWDMGMPVEDLKMIDDQSYASGNEDSELGDSDADVY